MKSKDHYSNMPLFHHSTMQNHGTANLLIPGPEDQVFVIRINSYLI